MLRDDLRPYFRLAVEQWSAEFQLPVRHPLFFYWVLDTEGAIEGYGNNANGEYWLIVGVYILVNGCIGFLMYLLVPEFGMGWALEEEEGMRGDLKGDGITLEQRQKMWFGVGV